MKNKKAVYLLVVLIAGIWGVIIYRFFNFASSSENSTAFQSSFVPPVLSSGTADTFSIAANYRDPFLGRVEVRSEVKKPAVNPLPKKAVEPLKWPTITYGGVIKSRKSNSQLCMVIINGQSNFMKEGDAIADVKLKKVYKDSIEVTFQKEKRMIKK